MVKDIKGLYKENPNTKKDASLISEISTKEVRESNFATLPLERVLLDLLDYFQQISQVQIVDGFNPDNITAAVNGEHIGTIVHR
ncbi:MAG: hypothetical protein O4861_12200 [Trichodesmium sp. St16_bin4-tuft]|nr:hypothetical protein [Trichodesmium sp. St18_bin3_1_1]MDE5099050.1 hypothetical protein [Trichodesmium sp. St16_bin4-tuft]MDE5102362.1 hypothetical protein [Trichodesmium sp. St19_bin2]